MEVLGKRLRSLVDQLERNWQNFSILICELYLDEDKTSHLEETLWKILG